MYQIGPIRCARLTALSVLTPLACRIESTWRMAEIMTFRIKNWEQFQHYKHRRPPWIRLYRTLLDDINFHSLPGDSVKTLVQLWLIASEDGNLSGSLPAIDELAFRIRLDSSVLARHIKQLNHWIIDDASEVLTRCKQDATPETETETEKSREEPRAPARDQKQKRSRKKTQLPDDWAPSDSHFELAKDLNLSAVDEAVKFREHAAANGRTMKDWNAAFNMWLRKAEEWKQGSSAGNQPGASHAWLRVVSRHLEHKSDVKLAPRDKRALVAIGGPWAVRRSDAKGLPFLKKQFCESWEAIGEHK